MMALIFDPEVYSLPYNKGWRGSLDSYAHTGSAGNSLEESSL